MDSLLRDGNLDTRPGIVGNDLATGVHSQLRVVRHSKISSVDVKCKIREQRTCSCSTQARCMSGPEIRSGDPIDRPKVGPSPSATALWSVVSRAIMRNFFPVVLVYGILTFLGRSIRNL